MSGVKVNDACIKMWEQLKTKKIKACNFKLSDNLKEIIVDEDSVVASGTASPWKTWTASLPDKECRYGYVINYWKIGFLMSRKIFNEIKSFLSLKIFKSLQHVIKHFLILFMRIFPVIAQFDCSRAKIAYLQDLWRRNANWYGQRRPTG